MQQTEKYWNLINRIVLIALAIMAIGGALIAFLPKVHQMQTYQNRCDELQNRIDITASAEKELKLKQQQFLSDPYYVEKVAHEVGYARKDEVIFQFLDEPETNEFE